MQFEEIAIFKNLLEIMYAEKAGGEERILKVMIHLLLTDYELVHSRMTTVAFAKLK